MSQIRRTNGQSADRTLEIWQPRTSRLLTCEDARQIEENMTGFFQILVEWAAAEDQRPIQITKTEKSIEGDSTRRRLERGRELKAV